MKKALPIIFLIILLLISVGANVYFAISKFAAKKDEVVVKYDDKKITKDELLNEIISTTGYAYIGTLRDEVLMNDISKKEKDNVIEEIDETMEQLEDMYGDELEAAIREQTTYTSKKGYRNYLIINKVYMARAEKQCDNENDFKCVNIAYYDEMIETLENAKITFKNDELKKNWETAIQDVKDTKSYYERYYSTTGSGEEVEPEVEANYDNLKEISYEELSNKMANKETFVLIISRTDCHYCLQYKPIMNEIAGEYKETFYYIETDHITRDEYNSLNVIVPFTGTTTTGIFKDGELDDSFEGYRAKKPVVDYLKEAGMIK